LGIKLSGVLLKNSKDLTIKRLFDQLKREQLKHEALEPIEALFNVSWRQLSDVGQQLAMSLSLFANAPIPWSLAEGTIVRCKIEPRRERKRDKLRRFLKAVLKGELDSRGDCYLSLDEPTIRQAQRELLRLYLLEYIGEERYTLHPLLRVFFAEKLAARREVAEWRSVFAKEVLQAVKPSLSGTIMLDRVTQIESVIPHLEELAGKTKTKTLLGDVAQACSDLSRFHYGKGEFRQGIVWGKRALELNEERFGNNHPDTAASLNNLAALYYSQGKYESAEPLYQRALDISERQLRADHPDTATSLNNLAALYKSQGKYESAEPLFQRALDISERQLGADHPDTATSLNNLAALYDSQGKYESAEPLYQRALDIWERQLGADHPHTATSLNDLAILYQNQKRYAEAIPLWERWRSIKRQRNEARNPEFATKTRALAQLYEKCEQYPEALQTYEEALPMFRELAGAKHPQTILIQGQINKLKKKIKQQKKTKF
jgi:tetratricopeptide (TPR) repeat protein